MQKLRMNLSIRQKEIPFVVGEHLGDTLCQYLLGEFPEHSIFVISDDTVNQLHGAQLTSHLSAHPGFKELFSFPAGEASKNAETTASLHDKLLSAKAGRDTVIVAFGGGVTGDMAGYVAATLHRGVQLVHVPTTLLAQVDSSIGGKVGVNHAAGKNLLGAFYQPTAVFSDIHYLSTLSDEEYINGMAEVVKYGVILDPELWQQLEANIAAVVKYDPSFIEPIIRRCIQLKIDVVEKDEKESGLRSILNWGHTVGHAIEKLSQYGVKHGFAIAEGMNIAARLSHQLLDYPQELVHRQKALFANLGLNTVHLHDYSLDDIWNVILTDKKARRQLPRFTLMRTETKPELYYAIEKQELEDAYQTE